MDILKQWVAYALLAGLVWLAIVLLPYLSYVAIPSGYQDIDGAKDFESYAMSELSQPSLYRRGDGVCFRSGAKSDQDRTFGWIAGMPGDRISIVANRITVSGGKVVGHYDTNLPDCGPITVPRGHFFVVSSAHRYDSLAQGFIPFIALRGKLKDFP